MRWPRPIIGLLIVANILADLCFWLINPFGPQSRGPEWVGVIFLALVLSQASLLAVWVAIGRSSLPIRVLIAATGIAVLYMGLLPQRSPSDGDPIILLFVEQMAVIAIPLAILLAADFRLRLTDDLAATKVNSRKSPLQFSIFNILQWTAAAAIAVAVSTHLIIPSRAGLVVTLFAAAVGIPVPLLVWSALSTTTPSWKLVAAAAVAGSAGLALATWLPRDSTPVLSMCFVQFMFVGAALYVARLSGFRFARGTP